MAKSPTVKGMVLAAGFGTRLRPITDEYPKPLVPIFGLNPLGLAIEQLRCAGIKQLAVNTHYQADKINSYLARCFDRSITTSYEPTILGTGGAYNPIRTWLGDSHLAVINGDIVSTIDVAKVVASHLESGALATMVLLPDVIPGESGVAHQDGWITGIGKYGKKSQKEGNFACMQVLSPEFFDYLPSEGVFDIISTAYNSLLQKNLPISAFEFSGMWHDIRSPKYYFAALTDIAARWSSAELTNIRKAVRSGRPLVSPGDTSGCPRFTARGSFIDESAVLGINTFVEAGAIIEADTRIENTVILDGAEVKKGTLVKNKILGKSFSIDLA
jgi:mannose-1-phosphate guanylyltransferase